MMCLFAALMLSGCSTGNSNEPSAARVTTNAEAASPQQIEEKTESRSDLIRTVTDVTGSVDIPVKPRKIALYLGTKMDGVIPLGQSESPNLEALLEAEPETMCLPSFGLCRRN
jgi:ABC-type Fe3+-hydroxamate transport system substrate-binding protein